VKVHVLQHVPFEDIGSMAPWLAARGAGISYTRFFEKYSLPEIWDIDLLIVMGGPMGVNDAEAFPWLRAEKQFICEAIAHNVAVLGVCLGAQLIAGSLGARIYRLPVKEIGWFPIEATSGEPEDFSFPKTCTVFHWHGEAFDLPQGAVRLAKSTVCENQAFQLKKNVIGLQFHLETTPQSAAAMIENCAEELVPGPYIQTAEQLTATPKDAYGEINKLMDQVLSYITHTWT
jgi:GMP synthase-like glutamine amidotransferase